MSDLLNRLVSRARGDPTVAHLKIEPVRAPRYTSCRDLAPAEPRELRRPPEGAWGFAKRLDAGPAKPLDSSVNRAQDEVAAIVTSNGNAGGRGLDSAVSSTVAATPSASQTSARGDAARLNRDRGSASPSEIPGPAQGTQGRELDPAAAPTLAQARAETIPIEHPPGRSGTTASRIAPATPPTVEAVAAPSIVVSIGHVEVRSKPAPPPPPIQRRPAFRPRLSLEAFLGRDGGRKP